MNKTRNIFRLVFFLLAVLLLVYLNRKTNDNAVTVVEFKFKMFEKIKTDSLDSKQKVEILVNDTEKFIDDSSRVRDGIRYLTLLFGLLVAVELGFLIFTKRNYERPGN